MKKCWLAVIGCLLILLLIQWRSRENNRLHAGKPATALDSASAPVSIERERRPLLTKRNRELPGERQQLEQQILDLLAADRPEDINKVYNELVPALVKLDPKAAAAFAQSAEAAKWREDLMMVIAQSWATLNPDDAQAWASNLQNPPDKPTERDTVVSYVGFSIANTDLARTVQLLQETSINWDRQEIMVENLAQQWAERDLQPLVKWLDTLPTGRERDSLFARIVNAQARINPIEAGKIVSEKIAPGPIQEDAALTVVRQWAWNDRDAATDWVNQFPAGSLHDRAARELARVLALRDGTN